jgi:hypothetical protein
MTVNQEDALYEFLENASEPFSLEEVHSFIRVIEPRRNNRLNTEIASFIDTRRIAFPLGGKRWVSRRGCFEPARFVIAPTRLELVNGILIPGHRCLPFANPVLLPQEYTFRWKGKAIPRTTTEGDPEDFYPFYTLFGEEYAPQYVAKDNPGNEVLFNGDPYEDPAEVSIHTLDMRGIFRESSFVPGDLFAVSTVNWKEGIFELEKLGKDTWKPEETEEWFRAAGEGFLQSFKYLGPGASTEEQIAFAYWFGGERMRRLPACTLEEFLYEKTDRIETAPYGIETRFWYAGRDIPDRKDLEGVRSLPDRTVIEEILYRRGAPISEFVVQSYVRDALYRNDTDIDRILERLIPRSAGLDGRDREYLADYIREVLDEFGRDYSHFADNAAGSLRQGMGELHTAVLDLAAKLQKSDGDGSWLPKHTFVVLSQIQGHAASVLEDLDCDEAPPEQELEAMYNSLDSMIDTFDDLKDLIDEARGAFRKNNITLLEPDRGSAWYTVQISLGGTEIWRRLVLPHAYTLGEMEGLIQSLFGWNGERGRFLSAALSSGDSGEFKPDLTIGELCGRVHEFLCEFGAKWTVKIMILSRYFAKPGERISCVAGAGAAPPRFIDGPLRFRRFISAQEPGAERRHQDYDPDGFDIESCNRDMNKGPS